MKIAISGKGGVGKTLLASLLSTVFVEFGYSVIAIDVDTDANLAATPGFIPYDQAVVEAALANPRGVARKAKPVREHSL